MCWTTLLYVPEVNLFARLANYEVIVTFYNRYSCYEHELPKTEVKNDIGHLTFRFLVGPSTDEMAIAEPYYLQQKLLMRDGFVQARHLVQRRPLVVVNDREELFPDDDIMFLEGNIRPLIKLFRLTSFFLIFIIRICSRSHG